MTRDEALLTARQFLERSVKPGEPSLMIDLSNVVEKGELLVVPYNSARFLRTRAAADQLLDCWPILVNLRSGAVRFGRLEERALWR